tara:strand:+ start:110 stop:757 length:648 start_codon:yes stop_codon:yes gene_type:complete
MIYILYVLFLLLISINFKYYNTNKGGTINYLKNYKLLKYENKIYYNTKIISRYDIYINNNNTIVYKIINNTKLGKKLKKSIQNNKEYKIYKNILKNAHKNIYNHTIPAFDIKRDGSYKSKYIKGYRLDKLNKNINKNILKKIIKQINILKRNLYDNRNNLKGDWALHNLIYSIKDNKIYNIDLEGYYSYQKMPKEFSIKMFYFLIDEILYDIFYF